MNDKKVFGCPQKLGEGKVKKGGVNTHPKTPPPPPSGQRPIRIKQGFEIGINTIYLQTPAGVQVVVLGQCVEIDNDNHIIVFDTGSKIVWED